MDGLLQQRRDAILDLAREHGVTHVRVFGSMARSDAGVESDVDLLVDLEQGRTLLDLGALLIELQDLLHRKVDVLTEAPLDPKIRERVLREAIPL
ncbi:MAG: nucleotidyltransferase [Betaproteobacteria bacterium]|nr:nucleotidyltransferase [Betaproteobacteria bacterium]